MINEIENFFHAFVDKPNSKKKNTGRVWPLDHSFESPKIGASRGPTSAHWGTDRTREG
jgi:hypothetical protein